MRVGRTRRWTVAAELSARQLCMPRGPEVRRHTQGHCIPISFQSVSAGCPELWSVFSTDGEHHTRTQSAKIPVMLQADRARRRSKPNISRSFVSNSGALTQLPASGLNFRDANRPINPLMELKRSSAICTTESCRGMWAIRYSSRGKLLKLLCLFVFTADILRTYWSCTLKLYFVYNLLKCHSNTVLLKINKD